MLGKLATGLLGEGIWGDLVGGALDLATGDVLGVGGTILTKALGLMGSSGSASGNVKDLGQAIQSQALAMQSASRSNAAGYMGESAAADAQRALGQQLVKASAVQDAAAMRRAAEQAADVASMLSQQNLQRAQKTADKTLAEASRMIQASGAPASAISAGLSKVGSSLGDVYDNAYQSSLQAQMQAAAQRQQAAAGAQDILNKSRATTFETEVAPHLVKTSDLANITQALAPTLGATYESKQWKIDAPMNALMGLTGGFRQMGAGRMGLGYMRDIENRSVGSQDPNYSAKKTP